MSQISDVDGISWSRNDLEFPGSKNPRISKSKDLKISGLQTDYNTSMNEKSRDYGITNYSNIPTIFFDKIKETNESSGIS